MILDKEKNKLILKYIYLARIEASNKLNKNNPLSYDDLYSIGYMTIINIILNEKYKTIEKIKAYITSSIRYNIYKKIKKEKKYIHIENNEQLENIFNKNIIINNENKLYYDKIKDKLVFLNPEDQKILRYIYKDKLKRLEIIKKIHKSNSYIYKRLKKIKYNIKNEIY